MVITEFETTATGSPCAEQRKLGMSKSALWFTSGNRYQSPPIIYHSYSLLSMINSFQSSVAKLFELSICGCNTVELWLGHCKCVDLKTSSTRFRPVDHKERGPATNSQPPAAWYLIRIHNFGIGTTSSAISSKINSKPVLFP